MRPFFILGLPRSRTTWLSRFLTYRDWTCGHEEIRHLRGLDDVKSWLSLPNHGSAETAAAPYWRILLKYRPDARIVTVRRPAEDVFHSLVRLHSFDHAALRRQLRYLDAKLDQVEARCPNAVSVAYAELVDEARCKDIFEYCLPYAHDREWWAFLAPINVQSSFPAILNYAAAFGPQMQKLSAIAKHVMLDDIAAEPVSETGALAIQEEDFESWRRDAQSLFSEHCVEVGESPDEHKAKNWPLMADLAAKGNMQIVTARCNGRMFGYLMTVLSPSLEAVGRKTAIHSPFYASKEFPGLGLKLQRFALSALREKGVDEVFFRAGPRGSGPKMGPLYKRLGAMQDGELYRLNLKDAA